MGFFAFLFKRSPDYLPPGTEIVLKGTPIIFCIVINDYGRYLEVITESGAVLTPTKSEMLARLT